MARKWLRSGALLAALVFSETAAADSRSVPPEALPGAVREAVHRRFPRGSVVAAFHAAESPVGEAWEVRVSDGLRERELALGPAGDVLGEREPVSPALVPEVAQRHVGRGAIWRAERLVGAEGVAYVLTYSRGTRLETAVVAEDGTLMGTRVVREG
jgi:hypothetical protein